MPLLHIQGGAAQELFFFHSRALRKRIIDRDGNGYGSPVAGKNDSLG